MNHESPVEEGTGQDRQAQVEVDVISDLSALSPALEDLAQRGRFLLHEELMVGGEVCVVLRSIEHGREALGPLFVCQLGTEPGQEYDQVTSQRSGVGHLRDVFGT